MLYKWISGDSRAIEGINDFEIVFRIPCRDVYSRDLTLFYEFELKNSQKIFPNTSSLHQQLKKCNILWVMDGFDESTAEFKGFLNAVLKDLPENHKVIITTRPFSSLQLLDMEEIIKKQKCELTLEKLNENQIMDVAKNCEIDPYQFGHYYKHLKYENKKFLENPLNLSLLLQLWSKEDNILLKSLNTNKLYGSLFEKQINELIKRLRDRTHLEDSELKLRVQNWCIEVLCKCAAESLLKNYFQLRLDQNHVFELTDDAINSHLIALDCLSTFLDSEESFGRLRYYFKHIIQKETLAGFYLRNCSDNELEFTCGFASSDKVSMILCNCNDFSSFLNLFIYFYKNRNKSILCKKLLRIESENRERFDWLKNLLANSEKKPNIQGIFRPQQLKEVVELFLPEVMPLNYTVDMTKMTFQDCLNAVHEYKDKVNFTLKYYFDIYRNDDIKDMIREFSKVFSDDRFKPNCIGAFLYIWVERGDPEALLKSLIDISEKLNTLTVEFHFFDYKDSDMVLDTNLLSLFASKIKVKDLILKMDSFKDFQLQILNTVKVERLKLFTDFKDSKTFSESFKKLNNAIQTNLPYVKICIKAEQLKWLYTNIPQEIAGEIRVFIQTPLVLEDVPRSEGKKIRAILIGTSDNYEIYKALKKIALQVKK